MQNGCLCLTSDHDHWHISSVRNYFANCMHAWQNSKNNMSLHDDDILELFFLQIWFTVEKSSVTKCDKNIFEAMYFNSKFDQGSEGIFYITDDAMLPHQTAVHPPATHRNRDFRFHHRPVKVWQYSVKTEDKLEIIQISLSLQETSRSGKIDSHVFCLEVWITYLCKLSIQKFKFNSQIFIVNL